MGDPALSTSLWVETTAEEELAAAEPLADADLRTASAFFWWGVASLALWGLVLLLILLL